MTGLDRLCLAMTEYEAGCPQRIQHFLKVHAFAALIGRGEGLPPEEQNTLEAAAYVHDIGIKPALEKYGSSAGKYQEALGAEPARKMLLDCGFDAETAERAAWLVAHHHTYDNIDAADYRILVEADFLVNLFEDSSPREAVESVYEKIFRTETGRRLCRTMFGL